MSIEQLWPRVKNVLKQFMPTAHDALLPPATDAEIKAAETIMGMNFSEDLHFMYRQNNGFHRHARISDFFLPGRRWCNVKDMLYYWQDVDQHVDQYFERSFKQSETDQIQWGNLMVKPIFQNRKWLPIGLSRAPGSLLLDFDPAPSGYIGQLISVSDGYTSVVAPSLLEWLDFFCSAFEKRYLTLHEDFYWMDMRSGLPKHINANNIYWQFYPEKLKPGVRTTL